MFLVTVCLSVCLIVSPTLIQSEQAATLLVQSLLNHLKTLWSDGNHVESRACVSMYHTCQLYYVLYTSTFLFSFQTYHSYVFNMSTWLIFLCIYKYLFDCTPNGLKVIVMSATWKTQQGLLIPDTSSLIFMKLKGQCHEIFDYWFFSWISFPQTLSILLRPFRIFSKIRGDIRGSRCTTGVNDIGGKWKKSSSRKILIILFGLPWVVELTYI